MIKLKYSASDGFRIRKRFKTLKAARRYAQAMIGKYPDFGRTYAVSNDGVGQIGAVEGVQLRELFGDLQEEPKP